MSITIKAEPLPSNPVIGQQAVIFYPLRGYSVLVQWDGKEWVQLHIIDGDE